MAGRVRRGATTSRIDGPAISKGTLMLYTILWLLSVILVVSGIVRAVRGDLVGGIVLVVVGLLVGPGGVSIF